MVIFCIVFPHLFIDIRLYFTELPGLGQSALSKVAVKNELKLLDDVSQRSSNAVK
jgi:hypothetical protein